MYRPSVRSLTVVAAVAVGTAILMANPPGRFARGETGASDSVMAVDSKLEEKGRQVAARIAYKESLIRDLVAGRMSLDHVAAEFLRLIQEEPVFLDMLRVSFPGASDDDRAARNVLEYVAQRPLPPAEMARVRARLEGDFARRFGYRPGDSAGRTPNPVG